MIPFLIPPLTGLQVLVTRPAVQAVGLSERIKVQGGSVLSLPVLTIEPISILPPQQYFDLLIFISTNAVLHGQVLLGSQPQARLAAVGSATAQALQALGHVIDVMPAQTASSEALLAHPLLQAPPAQVLIVRGAGGRELLRETLTARGSQVTVAEVYARHHAQPTAEQLQSLRAALQADAVDIISITSVDVLQALHAILNASNDASLWDMAQACTLLVGSARIATHARVLGFSGECIIAHSPEDAAMLAALTHWHTRARSLLR